MKTEQSLTELLDEIEQRASAATPGPWKAVHGDSYCAYPSVLRGCGGPHFILYDASENDVRSADDDCKFPGKDEDVDFIAATRSDVPRLVQALRRAVQAIEALSQEPEIMLRSDICPAIELENIASLLREPAESKQDSEEKDAG